MIVSTSITKGIDIGLLRNRYNGRVSIHRFHGAKVKHMKHYVPTHLAEELPDLVIVRGSGMIYHLGRTRTLLLLK